MDAPGVPADRELLSRLAAGDRHALTPLMERHYARLYRVALAYLRDSDEALDAVQETFMKAFEKADTWDDRAEVGPWLGRICVNQSIDRYRRRRRWIARHAALDDPGAFVPAGDPAPCAERRVFSREVSDRLGAALARLPERQRAVFVLRHYEGLSLEEIGATLEISVGTVKSSLHRALERVRRRLEALRP